MQLISPGNSTKEAMKTKVERCLLVFQKSFSFFYPFLKPLKIPSKFRCTPTLKGDKNIAFLTFKWNLQCQIHPFEVDTS